MSEGISENTSVPELKISDTYINHDDFVLKVQEYANFYNFQIRKEKSIDQYTNSLWHTLAVKLDHNHAMVISEHKEFLKSHKILEIKLKCIIKQVVMYQLLDKGLETWIYDNIYNYVYRLDGKSHPRCFEANEFINTLKQFKREIYGFEYEVKIDESTNELTQ
ncbi:2736_t:CDS:2, partial [Funneliformis mosseae]